MPHYAGRDGIMSLLDENQKLRRKLRELTGEGDSPLVGDADRDLILDRVREAFAGGYLTQDEADERMSQVLSSRTQAQLKATTRGLPAAVGRHASRGDQLVAFTARVWYLPYLLWLLILIMLIVVG